MDRQRWPHGGRRQPLKKDIKVEGDSKGDSVSALKTMGGDSISTVSQKNVYEVTLLSSSSRRQLHEERSTSTTYNASVVDSVVAQVACSSVLKLPQRGSSWIQLTTGLCMHASALPTMCVNPGGEMSPISA